MDKHLEANRDMWDALVAVHSRSKMYDVEGFRRGRMTLKTVELNEVDDVQGKTLLDRLGIARDGLVDCAYVDLLT